MRAAIYLRSSKDRSDVSIDAQRRQLQDLAAQRGLTIVTEFSDAVESGKDEDRPGFQSMLREMRNPKRGWDIILVLDTARIGRRRHIAIIFEEHECKRNGIKVIYNSLPDSDPITEMLLKSILQAMDEWHSLTSKAKGLAGMAENVKQGFRAGGSAPKGYRLESVATGTIREGMPVTKSKLVPNEESILVRGYLQHRAKGLSRASALAYIKQEWPVTTLLSMERNALTYAGHTVWNRHAEKAEGGGYVGGGKYRPRSEWIIQKNTHESLVTDDEAEIILAQVETRKKGRSKTSSHPYLLTGLLQSPTGEAWHASGDGSYRLSKGKRIKAENVDRAVLECVVEDITSDKFAKAVLDHYKLIAAPETKDKTLSKLISRVAELDKQSHNLAEMLSQTTAQATLLRSIEKMEEERATLEKLIEDQKGTDKINTRLRSLNLVEVKTMLRRVAEDLDDTNSALLKDALKSIIEAVVLDASSFEAKVTYRVGHLTGYKVASPRGLVPNPTLSASMPYQAPRNRRAA